MIVQQRNSKDDKATLTGTSSVFSDLNRFCLLVQREE